MAVALSKLPPGDDGVFRRLFDEENDCRLLICLLNAILAYPAGQRISQLTLLRTHVAGPLADDKEAKVSRVKNGYIGSSTDKK